MTEQARERDWITGAEFLLEALAENGVSHCFANPGTSELHLVAALDSNPGLQCVLGLFEGVCTGAADGYGRMADRPAATLLHLGPGLANGLSNLHNAVRARSPIVNIVGDHAVSHRLLDAPLTSDIEGAARPFSHWVRTAHSSSSLGPDAVAAIVAARSAPGRVATLIAPADATWGRVPPELRHCARAASLMVPLSRPSDEKVEVAASALADPKPAAILLDGRALREDALALAGRIASATGARLMFPTHAARLSRGAGRVDVDRVSYPVPQALAQLADLSSIVLIGAKAPVAFFAYPNLPGRLCPPGARIVEFATPSDDLLYALEALAERVAPDKRPARCVELKPPAAPVGEITPSKLAALLASSIPDNAIVVDESITTGRDFLAATRCSRPHDWLFGTGGAIGYGMSVAIGAALACPDRPVIVLESDGSGMYMPQALWTLARESLNVLVLIFANHKYQILSIELANLGLNTIGQKGSRLLDIGSPNIDWVSMARSMGVAARRATSMEELFTGIQASSVEGGPHLIEIAL